MDVRFKRVSSSNLSAVGYDKPAKELHVKFNYTGDKVYVYKNVTEQKYQSLIAAGSVGEFFHANVRYKHAEGPSYYDGRK
jgi:hypothetical protein